MSDDVDLRKWAVETVSDFHRSDMPLEDFMKWAERLFAFASGAVSPPGSFTPLAYGATPTDDSRISEGHIDIKRHGP